MTVLCHVIAPLDPSGAVRYARQLSEQLDTSLQLLVSTPSAAPVAGLAADPRDVLTMPSAPQVVRDAAAALEGAAVEALELDSGDPPKAVAAHAERASARLIVLTSTRRGPLLSGLMGRPQALLPGEARCPILAVPEGVRVARPIRRILCAVDGAPESSSAAGAAGALAARLDAQLTLIHVTQPVVPNASAGIGHDHLALVDAQRRNAVAVIDRARAAASGGVEPDDVVVEHPAPAHAVLAAAGRASADLVVVGTRGRGPLSAAALGSVSARVIAAAGLPVLLVPPGVAADAGEHFAARRGQAA